MKRLKNENGFILIPLLCLLVSLPLLAVFSGEVLSQAKNVSANMQRDLSMMRMGLLKTAIIRSSRDVDNDKFIEPLLPVPDGDLLGRLPLKMPLAVKDGWDRDFVYCAWDLGDSNASDPAYSQNSLPASLPAGLIARLISPGEDGIFQTNCASDIVDDGDLVENIFNSDVRAYSR